MDKSLNHHKKSIQKIKDLNRIILDQDFGDSGVKIAKDGTPYSPNDQKPTVITDNLGDTEEDFHGMNKDKPKNPKNTNKLVDQKAKDFQYVYSFDKNVMNFDSVNNTDRSGKDDVQ